VKDFVLKKLSRLPGIGRTTTVILPTVIKEITEWKPVEIEMMGEEQAKR